ncbi:hypothetical protein DPMN_191855 [Dreissena polymorpha]|uniref:Uncharacterized protein n=1 Tax=Dreissena polymorpha TaxID=45954 RepID=A0A9D3Y1C2_DREPO|nr:hypothetical protein DPMN_191855 [Dreissena polymorpha]
MGLANRIQVPGVDREMCLKKEFYYCDSTLQKQGLSCSEGKEEDFKKKSLLQLRPITRFQLQRCCRDVLTACDRKEIQQLCLDSSHETYIAVTVRHSLLLPVVSNVARARLWTEEDCQQRDWIQNTNPTTRRVFSTTRRVRFTSRRAVTTRRLCGNSKTNNSTARRAVTARRLNMQHNTKKHIRIVEENSQQQLVCKHYNAILQFDTNSEYRWGDLVIAQMSTFNTSHPVQLQACGLYAARRDNLRGNVRPVLSARGQEGSRSLRLKLDILEVEAHPYDVLVLPETWLTSSIPDDDIALLNF